MHLFALGLNHLTAPLSVRERVVFAPDQLEQALRGLMEKHVAEEAVIISTCNRTEIYCKSPDPEPVQQWFAQYHHMSSEELSSYLYQRANENAISHVFRVASGLDSMILGEPQILGQLKQAVKVAEDTGTVGTLLHKLFQSAFSVAKNVRSQTEIGANSISMAAIAVKLAERIYPSLATQRMLFIGSGEMIELCATHFKANHVRHMHFCNRTLERAQELAQRFNGSAFALNDLPERLAEHDIIITSTASPLPIIGKGMVERAIKARKHRPLFMVDLAVPRDIEVEVHELDDVFLYTVDDLGKIAQENSDARRAAVTEAETLITEGVNEFLHWLNNRDVVPTIRALRDHAEDIRRQELERALRRLENGENAEEVLKALSQSLTNKFLHVPTHALHHADAEDRDEMIALVNRLYQFHRKNEQ